MLTIILNCTRNDVFSKTLGERLYNTSGGEYNTSVPEFTSGSDILLAVSPVGVQKFNAVSPFLISQKICFEENVLRKRAPTKRVSALRVFQEESYC